jgi:hypothetical protein
MTRVTQFCGGPRFLWTDWIERLSSHDWHAVAASRLPIALHRERYAFMKKEDVSGKGRSFPGLGLWARHYLRQITL